MKFSLRKETCQYICTIFSVLILSILVKILFYNQLEHFNYKFILKFESSKPKDGEPILEDFIFKIGDTKGQFDDSKKELSFNILPPSNQLELKISAKPLITRPASRYISEWKKHAMKINNRGPKLPTTEKPDELIFTLLEKEYNGTIEFSA